MLGNIAVDAGSYSAKALVLGHKSGTFNLQYYAEDRYALEQVSKNDDRVAMSVKNILNGIKLKKPLVCMSVPYGEAIIREVTLEDPPSLEVEVEKAIGGELSNMIPFSIDEVYFDYVKEADNKYIVAVARKDIVDRKNFLIDGVWKKKNIRPSIDIDAYAYGRLIASLYHDTLESEGAVLVADIGKENTRFYVYNDGGLIFSRIQQLGGKYATESFVDYLGLGFEDAELKKLEGNFSQEDIENVVMPFAQHFNEQYSLVEDFYEASKKTDENIAKVVLCGGGAALKGLIKCAKKIFDMPIEIINLADIMVINGLDEDELNQFSAKYALSFALLNRGIKK